MIRDKALETTVLAAFALALTLNPQVQDYTKKIIGNSTDYISQKVRQIGETDTGQFFNRAYSPLIFCPDSKACYVSPSVFYDSKIKKFE